MRVPVWATVACVFALAGCEPSYSSSSTTSVTESGGEVVERTVEVQIGDRREPPAAEKAAATPAAADTPVASED